MSTLLLIVVLLFGFTMSLVYMVGKFSMRIIKLRDV